jgi:hypothetical protein
MDKNKRNNLILFISLPIIAILIILFMPRADSGKKTDEDKTKEVKQADGDSPGKGVSKQGDDKGDDKAASTTAENKESDAAASSDSPNASDEGAEGASESNTEAPEEENPDEPSKDK